MSQLEIEFPADRTNFEPQEEIDLDLSWELDEAPDSLELRLVWNTAGKGTTDLGVVHTIPVTSTDSAGRHPVRVTLPAAPYSFSGQLISLIWAFELVAFPSKASTRREITIGPGGHEVLLQAAQSQQPA